MPLLESVQIEAPCHEDWGQMRGNRVRRYCDSCKLHVHDLTAMTGDDAEALLEQSDGDVCIRMARDKRGKPITLDRFTFGMRLPLALTRYFGRAVASIAFLVQLAGCRFTGSPAPVGLRAVPGRASAPSQRDERNVLQGSLTWPTTQPAEQAATK